MTNVERPDRCQNCGYSKRHSRQKPDEVLEWVSCCHGWLCAGCRKLRACADPSTPPTSEMLSRHAVAGAVPINDGLYPRIPDDVYHGDLHSLSSSGARVLANRTPAEFLEYRNTPAKPKPHYDFGHAAHLMVLGAGAKLFVMDPAVHGRTKDGGIAQNPKATSAWKAAEAKAREQGKTCITKEQMDVAQRMAGKVYAHPLAARLLEGGTPEVSAYHHDDATGVRIRARFDCLPERKNRPIIVDYKTTEDASLEAFVKAVERFGYNQQEAWYTDAAAEHGLVDAGFVFIVQMKIPPFLVAVHTIEPDWVQHGRKLNRAAIDLYSECAATDTWPGHPETVGVATMPYWLRRRIEADDAVQ